MDGQTIERTDGRSENLRQYRTRLKSVRQKSFYDGSAKKVLSLIVFRSLFTSIMFSLAKDKCLFRAYCFLMTEILKSEINAVIYKSACYLDDKTKIRYIMPQ